MSQPRNPRTAPEPTAPARHSSWIPASSTPRVGLDPAHWATRARQVRLWRVMDSWYQNRRTH